MYKSCKNTDDLTKVGGVNFVRTNIFNIDLTFEMRTILYKIHLFNDDRHKHVCHIYMKWKDGERDEDSRETEKERV
jgi:hypothetical protein